ncbi:MAG: CinA family protein [Paracoccus sp. (in: a-proteobacteria)]|nr:CinA family protein [Paracoccus sp. (in: a-proteobacteria)]
MTLAEQVLQAASQRGVMIATAESCTAGLIAGALTDPPGASNAFDRGFVTYSNDAKLQMLGVRAETLDAHGAVSEPVAAQMASGALRHSGAGIAIAVTGIAGPGGSEHKPEGRVCFAVADAFGVSTETIEFGALGRHRVRAATVEHALQLLLSALRA